MALPWPPGAPTLPVPVIRVALPSSPTRSITRRLPDRARLRALAVAPLTALVAMLAGLALLFAYPLAGLPFVALVVLPLVVFHLRAEGRARLRVRR